MTQESRPPSDSQRSTVGDLVAANERSASAVMGLVSEVRRDADLRDRKIDLLERSHQDMKRLMILVAAGLLIILILGVTNMVNLSNARRNAAVTADIAKDARSTNGLLYDCLNSQGECGRRNTEANKKVLDEIKRYELVLKHCDRITALPDPDGDKLLACVRHYYRDGPTLRSNP